MPYQFFFDAYPWVLEPEFANDIDNESLVVGFHQFTTDGEYVGYALAFEIPEDILAQVYEKIQRNDEFFVELRNHAKKGGESS